MFSSTRIAKIVASLLATTTKPILAAWMGDKQVEKGRKLLQSVRIPTYQIPETAVRTFLSMCHYTRNISLLYETPAAIPNEFTPSTAAVRRQIAQAYGAGRTRLVGAEACKILSHYGIPVAQSALATTPSQALKLASKIGFPLVMKAISSEVLHKTESGGIRLNLRTPQEVKNAFTEISRSFRAYAPKADLEGVMLQEMFPAKHELLIGAKRDPIFGPVIVFGLGGVAVEVFKDIKIGLPPLNMALARRLIEGTKIFTLLQGYRGMPGVNLQSIQFLLYKFAYLLMDFPEIQEIDINPFAVDAQKGLVLDARILLDSTRPSETPEPYAHLVISPYPQKYMRKIRLRNRKSVLLRPILPEDEQLEAVMFSRMSEETQRFRFFSLIKEITHQMLIRFTQIDYDREIAIVAELREDRERVMAGVARLIADADNEDAEFAIVVADPWQSQGLGNALMDFIIEISRERQIKKVFANFLPDNQAMQHMFETRGFTIRREDDVCYAELIAGVRPGHRKKSGDQRRKRVRLVRG